MEFSILGPFEVRGEAGLVPMGGWVRRRLLCRLLLSAPSPVANDTLIEDVWDGRPPVAAMVTLRSHVRSLRLAIGVERVCSGPGGYRLTVAEEEVDSLRFEGGVRRGSDLIAAGRTAEAVDVLRRALGLWRGEALVDFASSMWAVEAASALSERRLGASLRLSCCQLVVGAPLESVAVAKAELAWHPYNESLLEIVGLALYRCGRHTEALEVLGVHLQELKQRGMLPGSGIVELERRVLAHDPTLSAGLPDRLADLAGVARSVDRIAAGARGDSQLRASEPDPPWTRVFVGRADQILLFRHLLGAARKGERRMLIVRGEPGIGKTELLARLAECAPSEGMTVVSGGAKHSAGYPLRIAVQALSRFVVEHEEDGPSRLGRYPEELTRLVPEIAEVLHQPRQPLTASDDLERWRLFEAVASWLEFAGAGAPVVFLADDLQWADQSTLALLEHVMDYRNTTGLVVVGAYRSTEPSSELLSWLGRLQSHPAVTRCEMEGLTEDEIASWLSVTGRTEYSVGTARTIRRRTGGNPSSSTICWAPSCGPAPPTEVGSIRRRTLCLPASSRRWLFDWTFWARLQFTCCRWLHCWGPSSMLASRPTRSGSHRTLCSTR